MKKTMQNKWRQAAVVGVNIKPVVLILQGLLFISCLRAHADASDTTSGVVTSTSNSAPSNSSSTPSASSILNNANSINSALGEAKKSNTLGTIANIAGAGTHATASYTAFAAYAGCSGFCFQYLAVGIAEGINAVSSLSQASKHGTSTQNMLPDLCKTSAGVCNPAQYQWPDFNSCSSTDAACMQNQIISSGNPDLNSLMTSSSGTSPLGSAFDAYKQMTTEMQKVGATLDPKTGTITYGGKSYTQADLSNPAALKAKLGLTDEQMKKIEATKSAAAAKMAALSNDPSVQAAAAGVGVEASIAAANAGGGSSAGKGLGAASGVKGGADGSFGPDGHGGGLGMTEVGGGHGYGEEGDLGGSGVAGRNGLAASGLGRDRIPAAIAGKRRVFNGEPIGVSGDSIFDMMTRRYQVKEQQNSFFDPAIVDPR